MLKHTLIQKMAFLMQKKFKPFLIIEPEVTDTGKESDVCFLVYGEEKIQVFPTEYALLQGMLNGGIDLKEADEERAAIKHSGRHRPLTRAYAQRIISTLRKVLKKEFPDLVIPYTIRLEDVRLWTKDEIKEIQERIANPQPNMTYVDTDETGSKHLYINGKEICLSTRGDRISKQYLALASIFICRNFYASHIPIDPQSKQFQSIWKITTGNSTIPPSHFKRLLQNLRGAVNRAGLTITHRQSGRPGWDRTANDCQMVPLKPPNKPKQLPTALAA